MKKRIAVIAIALVLVLAMSVTAFAAAKSPTKDDSSSATTAGIPAIIKVNDETDWTKLATATELAKIATLSAEDQETFKAAYADIKSAVPEGYSARYFWFLSPAEDLEAPYDVTIQMDDMTAETEVLVMAYVDGAWAEMETTNNGDKTATATVTAWGPVAVLTK